MTHVTWAVAAAVVMAAGAHGVGAQGAAQANPRMSFFITSVGSGNGANLGGLAGADAHCQNLAKAVGAGNKQWRAYLSTQGPNAVNAKDRIGPGPWFNAKGVQIAANVADLHSDKNNLTKETQLTEKGTVVNGRGDTPNTHDILTGSNLDGTGFPAGEDHTCNNWTSQTEGSANWGTTIGRAAAPTRRRGTTPHPSKGCSQQNLIATGGNGVLLLLRGEIGGALVLSLEVLGLEVLERIWTQDLRSRPGKTRPEAELRRQT